MTPPKSKVNLPPLLLLLSCSFIPSLVLAIIVSDTPPEASPGTIQRLNLTVGERPSGENATQAIKLDSNSSFYYDADAFLLNKSPATLQQTSPTASAAISKPARGRAGRMLNLEALLGDPTATSGRSMISPAGSNRQSRQLELTAANGKKMKIQGFIPIMGLASGDELDEQRHQQLAESPAGMEQLLSSGSHKSNQLQAPREPPLGHASSSSLGHATFGVQRFLNTDAQGAPDVMQQQANMMSLMAQQQQQQQQPPAEHKFNPNSHSSMVDALKRPLRRLAGSFGSSQTEPQAASCLCVPFYMCKNGFVSEASLSRSQLQQLIAQQPQQQQQPRQLNELPQLSGLNAANTQPNRGQVESVSLVDERSFGSQQASGQSLDIVTVAPEQLDQQITTTTTTSGASSTTVASLTGDSMQLSSQESLGSLGDSVNSGEQVAAPANGSLPANEADQSADYTKDILGRMLGLKSAGQPSRDTSQQQHNQMSSSPGNCGLLRTCCSVSGHLLASLQSELAAASRTAAMLSAAPMPSSIQTQLPVARQTIQQQQQQQQALQRYQPYGLPSQALAGGASVGPPRSFMNRISVQSAASQTPISQLTRAASFGVPASVVAMQQAPPIQVAAGAKQHLVAPLGTRRLLEGRCGLRQAAGITGRVQNLNYHESSADFGEYPAQAAILKRLNGSESLFVCAGTLISQQWVATAAHCVRKHQVGELKVRLGEWDVHRDDEFYPYVEMEIRDLLIHPDFQQANLINDLALLRLDKPVDPSLPHINPACLPSVEENFRQQRCWVTGWGKDSFGQRGSFQSVLQEVELPVVGHSECEQALRRTRLGPHYRLHAGFVCAGGEGGKDACEGDGGSGLYCAEPGSPLKAVGLVSWGIGCGQQGVPGVYVSLAHFRPWIENIISIDEDIYSPNYSARAAAGSSK